MFILNTCQNTTYSGTVILGMAKILRTKKWGSEETTEETRVKREK